MAGFYQGENICLLLWLYAPTTKKDEPRQQGSTAGQKDFD
jgi:hypothetical protein